MDESELKLLEQKVKNLLQDKGKHIFLVWTENNQTVTRDGYITDSDIATTFFKTSKGVEERIPTKDIGKWKVLV